MINFIQFCDEVLTIFSVNLEIFISFQSSLSWRSHSCFKIIIFLKIPFVLHEFSIMRFSSHINHFILKIPFVLQDDHIFEDPICASKIYSWRSHLCFMNFQSWDIHLISIILILKIPFVLQDHRIREDPICASWIFNNEISFISLQSWRSHLCFKNFQNGDILSQDLSNLGMRHSSHNLLFSFET